MVYLLKLNTHFASITRGDGLDITIGSMTAAANLDSIDTLSIQWKAPCSSIPLECLTVPHSSPIHASLIAECSLKAQFFTDLSILYNYLTL